MIPEIAVRNLRFNYPDGTSALDSIELDIKSGERIGIIGANGAGKSTLVNHLNGFYLPQHGSVVIRGIELTKKSAETIRKFVGLVFQNSDDQLFMSRVYDDVCFGPQNLGLTHDEIAQKAEKCLRSLGIWELRDRPPFHLSQGQKRFAALASILVMEPSIIIMDEPTSDLDPRARKNLMLFVNQLESTRIIVSHDLDFIWDTCDRVILLADGKIACDGAARDILTNEKLLVDNGLELPLRNQRLL